MREHGQQAGTSEAIRNFFEKSNFLTINHYSRLTNIVAIGFLVFLACGIQSPAHGGANVLRNHDFEDWGSGQQLQHWLVNSGTVAHSSDSESGVASVRITSRADHGNEGSIRQPANIHCEQILDFYARLKTDGDVLVRAEIRAYNANNTELLRGHSPPLSNCSAWTDLQWRFRTPAGTQRVTLFLRVATQSGPQGNVLIDRAELFTDNLFLNPSFDDWGADDQQLQRWLLNSGTVSRSTDSESGVASVRITSRADHNNEGSIRQLVDIDGEQVLNLHARLKTSGDVMVYAQIRAYDGDSVELSRGDSAALYGCPDWTDLNWKFRTPIDTGRVTVFFRVKTLSGAQGNALIDQSELIINNLVLNPNFDNWGSSGTLLQHWLANSGTRQRSTDSATGGASLRLITRSDHNNEGSVRQPVFFDEEHNLDFQARVKTQGDVVVWAQIRAYDANSAQIHIGNSDTVKNCVDWTTLRWRYKTPPGTWSITPFLRVRTESGAQGSAYFDEVTLARVTMPEVPDPEPLAPAVAEFFPFGGYLWGISPGAAQEAGSTQQLWSRTLRLFRRNYMNMVTSGLMTVTSHLSAAQNAGQDWYSEKLRSHDMRVIPRQETLRILTDVDEKTRAMIVAEWRATYGESNFGLLQWYAANYNDIILGYDIGDEPYEWLIQPYLYIRDEFKTINALRPAMPVLLHDEVEYMPYVPIFYGDIYPIRSTGTSNPWSVGSAVRGLVNLAQGQKPVWMMLQAFGHDQWGLPTEAQTRYMANAAFANGGKSLVYHGLVHQPRWLVNRGYNRNILSVLGTWTPQWHVLRETGKHLAAVGMATMGHLPVDDSGIIISCGTMSVPGYSGPTMVATVLAADTDCRLIVVQNQDLVSGRSGTLQIPAGLAAGRRVWDMKTLVAAGAVDATSISINISLPGDARLLYLATSAEIAPIFAGVRKHRYLNEKAIYVIDAELAVSNGVDVSWADTSFQESQQAFSAGQFITALAKIIEARDRIDTIISQASPLGAARSAAESARQALSEVTELYCINIATITPDALVQITPKDAKFPMNTGLRPVEVDSMVETTADLIGRLNAAEDSLYLGQAAQVVSELQSVATAAASHLTQVAAYLGN